MSRILRQLFLLLCALQGICYAYPTEAREALPEYTLKVGFLYNFALLTEWPAYALMNDRIDFCFIADDEFRQALDSIRGKVVKKRQINIRSIENSEQAKSCNIIYFGQTAQYDIEQIMREAVGQPILTVTDDEQLASAGVVFYLRPEGQRLVFEIDSERAKSVRLNISSRLLRLAR
jgi:hypothetical protein